tara:strand:- start:2299 stop:3666 length:1368 start_codon:yes stop_codon:yes gene_type:complete
VLDQSFSASNFRKIFDLENRKGNYLEGRFFPDIADKSKEIQSRSKKLRELRKIHAAVQSDDSENEVNSAYNELKELKEERDTLIDAELTKVSEKIREKSFSLNIQKGASIGGKPVYTTDNTAESFFALKQIQHNFRRLYKVKQANRHQIVCQVRELLGDSFPKYVIRTDISSFYESIPTDKLLKKLRDDSLLSVDSRRIVQKIIFEYCRLSGSSLGIPRGIGISAYLAELYMREIDETIIKPPAVIYYSRYVDDMLIVFCPEPNQNGFELAKTILTCFRKHGLKRNSSKTDIKKVPDSSIPQNTIEYLGYKITFSSGKEKHPVPAKLAMTDAKLDRYKRRIDLVFAAYQKKSRYNEKQARRLLEKRIRFLTSNTRLVNNKKHVVSGVFFSNPLLTELDDLQDLDAHLQAYVSALTVSRLQARLSNYSFEKGFQRKRYHKFSAQDLSAIVEAWKNV